MIRFFSERDLLTEIVRPTLRHLAKAEPRINSAAAERIVLVTAAYESKLQHLTQVRGPARSLWQIEPPTADDLFAWIAWHDALDSAMHELVLPAWTPDEQLAGNHHLACALARLLYWRVPDALPGFHDIDGLAAYYKDHYNTAGGKGSADEWATLCRQIPVSIYD